MTPPTRKDSLLRALLGDLWDIARLDGPEFAVYLMIFIPWALCVVLLVRVAFS